MNRLSGKIFWEGEGGKETTFIQPCFNNLFTTHTNMIREWIKWVRVRENNRLQKKKFQYFISVNNWTTIELIGFWSWDWFWKYRGSIQNFCWKSVKFHFHQKFREKKILPLQKISPPPIKRRVLFFFFVRRGEREEKEWEN